MLLLIAACAGCKGEDPIQLTFSPGILSASFAQGDRFEPLEVTVSLSRVPTSSVYVGLVQDAPVVDGTINLVDLGRNRYQASVSPICTLEPGVHRGHLTVQLCRDEQCQETIPLAGNTLPYEFTVAAGTSVDIAIDGVRQPVPWFACAWSSPPTLKVGQRVEFTSSRPARWSSSVSTSAGVPTLTDVVQTATSWAGTVGSVRPCGGGTNIGSISVVGAFGERGSSADLDAWFSVLCWDHNGPLVPSPARLAFSMAAGGSAPAPRTLSFTAEGAPYAWTASVAQGGGPAWLSLDGGATASGSKLPGSVTASVGDVHLPPGTYSAEVHLEGGGHTIAVPASLVVRPPALQIASPLVALSAVAGQQAAPATGSDYLMTEVGSIPYTTTVSYGPGADGWLTVTATETTAPATVTLTPTRADLPAGTYSATVTFTPGNGAPEVRVEVRYTLVTSQLSLAPAQLTFSLGAATLPADLGLRLDLADTGAPLTWTVTASVPWLSVSPSSGTSGTTATVTVDPAAFDQAANGAYPGTLTFRYDGSSVSGASRELGVTVNVALPLVEQVAPYVSYSDRLGQVVVRGQGFRTLSNPTVMFGSTAASGATVSSDTELRVVPPSGLAAGRHLVRVVNPLGLPRSRVELVSRSSRTHTAGLIRSAGPRSRLIHDAERDCFYGAHAGANQVQRFCDGAGGWVADALTVGGVLDVAMAPGGRELIAISPDKLHRIDLATFAITASTKAADLGIRLSTYASLHNVVITNDGHVLITAGYSWLTLYRYPLGGGTTTPLSGTFFSSGGPQSMGVSLDGSRVITGEAGISSPHFVVYEASTGTVTTTAIPPNQYIEVYSVTVDRMGQRIGIGSSGSVYDAALSTIGSTATCQMAVSADGARAYAYMPGATATLSTYDISGSSVQQIGAATTLSVDPDGAGYGATYLLTSQDSRTLFIDGTEGILVMAAP